MVQDFPDQTPECECGNRPRFLVIPTGAPERTSNGGLGHKKSKYICSKCLIKSLREIASKSAIVRIID